MYINNNWQKEITKLPDIERNFFTTIHSSIFCRIAIGRFLINKNWQIIFQIKITYKLTIGI